MPKVTKTNSSNKARRKTGIDEETVQEMIRKKAYELHEQRGGQHGRELEDWLEAERTVKTEMKKRNKEARSQNPE
jgi:hypothetical protein